jgi:hypothetical protein
MVEEEEVFVDFFKIRNITEENMTLAKHYLYEKTRKKYVPKRHETISGEPYY